MTKMNQSGHIIAREDVHLLCIPRKVYDKYLSMHLFLIYINIYLFNDVKNVKNRGALITTVWAINEIFETIYNVLKFFII